MILRKQNLTIENISHQLQSDLIIIRNSIENTFEPCERCGKLTSLNELYENCEDEMICNKCYEFWSKLEE